MSGPTTRRNRRVVVALVTVVAVILTGCHGANTTKNGEPVHEAAMKAKVISVTRTVLTLTGIKFTGSAGMTWESCDDSGTAPFRGTVSLTFAGQTTLAESEAEVDRWVAVLHSHGWSAPQQVPHNATRYLAGPQGFSAAISPHVEPKVNPGPDLTVSSPCVVTDDVGHGPGYDVTTQLRD
jgi:hypothetical protein